MFVNLVQLCRLKHPIYIYIYARLRRKTLTSTVMKQFLGPCSIATYTFKYFRSDTVNIKDYLKGLSSKELHVKKYLNIMPSVTSWIMDSGTQELDAEHLFMEL